MISMVIPLHAGNALRLFLEPIAGAVTWKILRKGSATFSGVNDASALLVYSGDEKVIVDDNSVPNGVLQYYCPFYTADGGATWTAGLVASGMAAANYADHSTDSLSVLRDRLQLGLKIECERGTFVTELGYIQVFTAPPVMDGDIRWPLVSVHLESESPGDRAIGEEIQSDDFDSIGGDWQESEGWLANVRIAVVGWALNGDQRIDLRKALRRIIVANLPVFEDHGMMHVDFSMQDVDAVNGEYPAQIYQAVGSFSCVAPVRVTGGVPAISDITVENLNA